MALPAIRSVESSHSSGQLLSVIRSARAQADEVPAVSTVHPERHTLERSIEQPGQIEGYEQSPLYPKIAGYVARLNVDIGDRVTKGQVLAELSVPEVVEEHRQKQATVAQTRARVVQARRALATAGKA